ncbi:MAG TPA: DUF6496 domain-containing protein [Acetobacteraceae bacterium]|nr:DUF6496 domain-containing protein [Acetobacteraceae bacterium]
MAQQTEAQRKTVSRVMHEFRHGELESSRGGKVKSRRQAVAIGLSEAGASNQQSPGQNRRQYARTKRKERRGETAQQEKEGRRAMNRGTSRRRSGSRPRRGERTRAQLYKEAQRRKIPGRSRMNKSQLQRALRK